MKLSGYARLLLLAAAALPAYSTQDDYLSNVPVCGSFYGFTKTFRNAREFSNEYNSIGNHNVWNLINLGPCPSVSECKVYNPVCGVSSTNKYQTFLNPCLLEADQKITGTTWRIFSKGICMSNPSDASADPLVSSADNPQKSLSLASAKAVLQYIAALSKTVNAAASQPDDAAPANNYVQSAVIPGPHSQVDYSQKSFPFPGSSAHQDFPPSSSSSTIKSLIQAKSVPSPADLQYSAVPASHNQQSLSPNALTGSLLSASPSGLAPVPVAFSPQQYAPANNYLQSSSFSPNAALLNNYLRSAPPSYITSKIFNQQSPSSPTNPYQQSRSSNSADQSLDRPVPSTPYSHVPYSSPLTQFLFAPARTSHAHAQSLTTPAPVPTSASSAQTPKTSLTPAPAPVSSSAVQPGLSVESSPPAIANEPYGPSAISGQSKLPVNFFHQIAQWYLNAAAAGRLPVSTLQHVSKPPKSSTPVKGDSQQSQTVATTAKPSNIVKRHAQASASSHTSSSLTKSSTPVKRHAQYCQSCIGPSYGGGSYSQSQLPPSSYNNPLPYQSIPTNGAYSDVVNNYLGAQLAQMISALTYNNAQLSQAYSNYGVPCVLTGSVPYSSYPSGQTKYVWTRTTTTPPPPTTTQPSSVPYSSYPSGQTKYVWTRTTSTPPPPTTTQPPTIMPPPTTSPTPPSTTAPRQPTQKPYNGAAYQNSQPSESFISLGRCKFLPLYPAYSPTTPCVGGHAVNYPSIPLPLPLPLTQPQPSYGGSYPASYTSYQDPTKYLQSSFPDMGYYY